MKKDPTLINIYLKIHNKRTLFLDDLRYLAQYAPECFEKTCKNVVYNLPETKPIMDPAASPGAATAPPGNPPPDTSNIFMAPAITDHSKIEHILENIKRLEAKDLPPSDIDANQVKNLLGNLYMELLFPHNDIDTFFNLNYTDNTTTFDRKA